MITASATIAASIETARPRVINPWIIALAVVIPTFMEVLDTTIANVALRYMAGGLSAPASDSEWVITSYLAANAIVLPMSGWLGVRLGRRNYFLLSIAVFTLASALCGLAMNLDMLIAARVLQGLAGGGLQPSSQGVLLDAFSKEKQGAAQTLCGIAGATNFNRPEDASWDPSNPNDLYFVTTASFTGKSRLWHLHFNNPADPAAGGTATVLIDGSNPNGPKMMDNITVNKRGTILIQEDVGGQAHIGKVWRYSIATGALEIIAQHDPERFTPGAPGFLTLDEESSGIIAMDDILGEGWYLLDVQAHYNAGDSELVEGGQLLGLHFAPGQEKK